MEVNEYGMTSTYFQSFVDANPLGIIFQPPRNLVKHGERCPRRAVAQESNLDTEGEGEESDTTESDEEPRKNKGKRQSKVKRSRQDVSTSTGSSGGSGYANSFNGNEIRFLKTTAKMRAKLTYKKFDKKLFLKMRKWLDDALELFRCSSSHRSPIFHHRNLVLLRACTMLEPQ